MKVETLAIAVIEACEAEGVAHMVTGAFAYNFYGIPRSTKDVDIVIDVLAVQGTETLDMPYIENWCDTHRTRDRLTAILESLPEF